MKWRAKDACWQAVRLNQRNLAMALIDTVLSVIAFHEKAGRSQGDSFWYLLVTPFLPRRVATVATLPSALFNERLLFARCQLGVLVSAGAATCLSTSVPSRR